MKKIYLLIFFFNAFASLKSQLKVNMGEGTLGAGKVNWDNQFIILDKNGGMFHSYYEGVDGHPYFQESFKWATVKLSSGETFNNVSARLDIYKQMVQIKLNGDTAKYILPGNIYEITFYDTIQSVPGASKFRIGYPDIDKQNKNNFYQVLADGTASLIKSSVKKINKLKNEMTGEVSSQFDSYDDYYLYLGNEMQRLKKDKDFILNLLSAKRTALEQFVAAQKINFKSIESIKKLVDYYNSISEKSF